MSIQLRSRNVNKRSNVRNNVPLTPLPQLAKLLIRDPEAATPASTSSASTIYIEASTFNESSASDDGRLTTSTLPFNAHIPTPSREQSLLNSDADQVPPSRQNEPLDGRPVTPLRQIPSPQDLSPQPDDDDNEDVIVSTASTPARQPSPPDLRPDVDYTAKELFNIINGSWQGCGQREHERHLAHHFATHEGDHFPIEATYEDLSADKYASRSEVGLESDGFPPNRGLRRDHFTSAYTLQLAFEGSTPNQSRPKHICLEQETPRDAIPITSFDIDSIIVLPTSLGLIKKGLEWCPAKNITRNIQKDMHVSRTITYYDTDGVEKSRTVPLQFIPHLYIGSVDGLPHSATYLFFPHLYNESDAFVSLTDIQAQKVYDRVLWPVFSQHVGASNIQHFPPSQQMAELNARANSSERSQGLRGMGSKQFATYYIPGDHLDICWDDILARVNDIRNEASEFQDLFILVNSKNTKSRYRTEGSFYENIEEFRLQCLDQVFHISKITSSQLQLDLGVEICCPFSRAIYGDRDSEEEATVYLWRECCLQQLYTQFQNTGYDSMLGQTTFYNTGYLRDAATFRSTPPKTSKFWSGGLRYIQLYNSVKEIFDSQTVYPFQNPLLPELGVDPVVWAALANEAKVTNHKSREQLHRIYKASKNRLIQAIAAGYNTSTGLRLEIRGEWDLVLRLAALSKDFEAQNHLPYRLESHPDYGWVLPTRRFLDFVRGNFDKFVKAIEISSITSPVAMMSLDRTQLITVLFKCLSTFLNTNLQQHTQLALDEKVTDEGETLYGLGMQDTMQDYGFAWFCARVDWAELRLSDRWASHFVGRNSRLVRWYNANASRDLYDRSQDIVKCTEWLVARTVRHGRQTDLLLHICHLLLQQFRSDCLKSLEKDFVESLATQTRSDTVSFTWQGWSEVLTSSMHQVAGNKTKFKKPQEIFEWFWGESEQHRSKPRYQRKYFDNKGFRTWYFRLAACLGPGSTQMAQFDAILQRQFFLYHPVVPYPDSSAGTMISTAHRGGARQFYVSTTDGRGLEGVRWVNRGQSKAVHHHQPPPYPNTLKQSAIDLERYFTVN